jgi:uncharacterized protein YqhQ
MKEQKKEFKTTIGGQAILEGIVMKGPRKSCTVVRKPDQELVIREIDTIPLKEKNPIWGLPIIRGAANMFIAMKEGMEAINFSAQFIEDESQAEPSKFEKWLEKKVGSKKLEEIIFAGALFVGIMIPVLLFILLPTLLAGFLPAAWSNLALNLVEGAVRIAIFLLFMFIISKTPDIHRTFRYHGAEHKTIFCYEKGLDLTVENVRPQPRQHPRCGTSFLFVVMIISILMFSVVTWTSPVMRMVIRLALLPVVVGVSYEFNRYVGKIDNGLTRVLRAPGLWLQKLTVFEPDDSMIEVAIEALKRVIPEKAGEDQWQ